jgi:hypothetical protein
MGVTNLDDLTLSGTLTGDVAGTVTGDIVTVNVIDVEGLATAEEVLSVPDVASGGVLAAHTTQVMSHSLRIQSADGTNYYIMLTDTVTNRTGGA